jgi:hypothetical protein
MTLSLACLALPKLQDNKPKSKPPYPQCLRQDWRPITGRHQHRVRRDASGDVQVDNAFSEV